MVRPITAVILISLGLATCSWNTRFFIANRTNRSLHVEYTARRIPAFPSPTLLAITDLEEYGAVSRPASAKVTQSDSLLEYSLLLPADSAVLVLNAGTYTGSDGLPDLVFEGLRLSVETPRGPLTFQGGEISRAFHKWSRTAYVLELK